MTVAGGEPVRAFVPAPPSPDGPLQQTLEAATLALGRPDAASALLSDVARVLCSCARREAVLSSRSEGTQSSLTDVLLFEPEKTPGVPLDDVLEVSNRAAALEHGLRRLREAFPLPDRSIHEIHAVLLSRVRGSGASAERRHIARTS